MLVNDFGSINIDAELVVGIENDGDIIILANGCVCCNIRDDLVAAVTQVIERPEQPEYILLEASGVADPSGIALTFMDEDMRDRIRLDSIMCVVDAEQVFAAPEMMELKLRQVAFADMLSSTRSILSPEEIERIKAWLDDRFHRYRLVEASGEMCLWRSCCRSADSIPPGRDRTGLPGLTRLAGSLTWTTTRRSSGRGATKRKSLFRWKRCGKRRASYRPVSTDARAWFIPRRTRPAGHPSSRRQASGYHRRGRMERPRTPDPDRRHRHSR